MELKPGYKQTEVGVIPEDWEVRTLQELCKEEITYGIVQCGPHIPGGIPYIRVSDMDGPILDKEKMLCTSAEIASQFRRSEVRLGDIVYALRGRLGDVRAITPELEGANLTQGTARISPALCVHSPYLLWALRNPDVVLRACAESKGTTFMEITLSDLRKVKIAVPPRSEQLEISSTLSDIDNHLMTLNLELTKKRNIKQAAMQELLTGKRRLPGFEGEWGVKRLGEIASIDPESLGNNTHPNYRFNYISLEDVNQGSLLGWSEQEYVSAPSRARRKLRPNDVLISTVRPNLKSHLLFDQEGGEWICSTGFALLRCNKDTIEPAFVYFHLFGDTISKQIEALLTGSNYPAINSRDVRNLEIPVPALLEQKEIVRILKSMEDELISLAQQFEKASSLKQGMMQQLLTGKIRLT